MKKFLRFSPIILILLFMLLAYFFDLFDFLSFDSLKEYNNSLKSSLQNHPILFPLLYILIYIVATALSIPGALFLTITAGFLFGKYLATVYVVIGATIGASILFIAAKTAIKDFFIKKAGKLMNKISVGFQKNAKCYLLFLRLIPLFPFWLVNIAPALFNIKFRTFLWTTFFGIIPGSFIYAQAGVGLESLLRQEKFSIDTFITFEIKLALILLGLLMLLPIIFKKIKKKIC